MANKRISQLPQASELKDDSLLVVEQQEAGVSKAKSITGALVKKYAIAAAETEADKAADSATSAATAQSEAELAKTQADAAKDQAVAAKIAIENMEVTATTLPAGSNATVSKNQGSGGSVKLSFGLPRGSQGDPGPTGVGIISIVKTSGTGAPGSTDTYTITLSDGSTATFSVYNGADGQGAGDMTKAVYDPQNKAQNIYDYADSQANGVQANLNTHVSNGSIHVTSAEKTAWNSKQSEITASGLLKGNGSGGVTAAVAGTDYLKTAPVTSVNGKTGAVMLSAADVSALPESGGALTGMLTAQSNTGYGTAQVRNEKLMSKTNFDAVTDWTAQLSNGGIAWCYE